MAEPEHDDYMREDINVDHVKGEMSRLLSEQSFLENRLKELKSNIECCKGMIKLVKDNG